MVRYRPEQGRSERHLLLIGCARGLDAQAESWRLQAHIDSGGQKEALFAHKALPRITGRQPHKNLIRGAFAASLWQQASLRDSTTQVRAIPG
jgi:hypothetical protein